MKFLRTYNLSEGEFFGETNWRGKPNGFGTIRFRNGDSFSGEFVNGAFPRHGLYTFDNGDSVSCDIVNGRIHGDVTYDFIDGGYAEGHYVNGVPTGRWIKYKYGQTFELNIVNGEIVSEKRIK